MRILGSLWSLLSLAARRSWSRRWLMLCLLLGLVVAVGLLSSIPLYADAAQNRLLQGKLESPGTASGVEEATVQLTVFSLPVIGLVAYFISLIAGMVVQRGQSESAVLRSRGITRRQRLVVVTGQDARQMIAAEQTRPERQGSFGLLSVGFIAAAVLTVVGFLVYAVVSFQRRFIELGMLCAIGLSKGQMAPGCLSAISRSAATSG